MNKLLLVITAVLLGWVFNLLTPDLKHQEYSNFLPNVIMSLYLYSSWIILHILYLTKFREFNIVEALKKTITLRGDLFFSKLNSKNMVVMVANMMLLFYTVLSHRDLVFFIPITYVSSLFYIDSQLVKDGFLNKKGDRK